MKKKLKNFSYNFIFFLDKFCLFLFILIDKAK